MAANTHTAGDALDGDQTVAKFTGRAGLYIQEPAVSRAFASVLEGLDLRVEFLSETLQEAEPYQEYEIIVGDQAKVAAIRELLDASHAAQDFLKPSLVAVGPRMPQDEQDDFDAFIVVPSMINEVAARLSVVLYSHRALARRYKSALEELTLNRNIFRSVTNGISVANAQLPDMPLMYVNPSFELMTGYSLEEVQGRNCRFLQGDDHDQPGLLLIREAIASKRQTVAILRNYRKDGTCFWNELTLSPIFNHSGEVTHFVGIQLDVSDRVRVEGALRESEKLAAVGRLASTISHEINNPLEAVMNLVYLSNAELAQSECNEQVRQYLKIADEELQRVKLIAAQSLRFAKQSSNAEAVLLNQVVESVLDVYRARLRNYGVEVKLRLRSTQHVVVFESELRQVLSNLVNNGIDAMKNSPRRVLTIRTREAHDFRSERSGVLLTISDCGTGMPPDVREKLFDAFFTTKGQNGTGLGLWVSKGIVERHHGVMLLRSNTRPEKNGTTFEIFLPFQAASGDATGSSGLTSARA